MHGRRQRPIRFLLYEDLARRLDEAVAEGLGGFRDRHELANVALDEYLIELEHPSVDVSPTPLSAAAPWPAAATREIATRADQFALPSVEPGLAVADAVPIFLPR